MKFRTILLAVIFTVTASFYSFAQNFIFRGEPQGIEPSNYPTYTIQSVDNKYRFSSVFYAENSTGVAMEGDATFLDLTGSATTLSTVTSIGASASTNTCYLFLGFGTNTTPIAIYADLSTAFSGSTVVYAYDSAKTWVNFTPTGNNLQWNTTGRITIQVPTLPGISTDTMTTAQSALKYMRVTFTGASTSKALGLDLLYVGYSQLVNNTTINWYVTPSRPYVVSTTPCYLTGVWISSFSANTVDFYNLYSPESAIVNTSQIYSLKVPANTMGYYPMTNPIYFSLGCCISPIGTIDLTPFFYH